MKIPSRKIGIIILFASILLGLQGCGGDSASPGAGGAGGPAGADVKFVVKWVESAPSSAANKILNAAQGIKVTATGPRITTPISNGVNRTTGSAQQVITLNAVPTGEDQFLIEVFNTTWDQATSENLIQQTTASLTVNAGSDNQLTANLTNDLCFAVAVTA